MSTLKHSETNKIIVLKDDEIAFTFGLEFRHIRIVMRWPETFQEAFLTILALAGIFRISPLF